MPTNSYATAGVNLELGDDASKIMFEASKQTWGNRTKLPGEIELSFESFSAVRFADTNRFPGAILGMNFDGVGTKIEVAERVGDHSTVAFDLFAMVCDDAARTGGEPILFGSILDCRKLSVHTVKELAQGMIAAARVSRVAVINGEIAELGNRVAGYNEQAYNWGAGVTWIGDRNRMISGTGVTSGQAIVAVREKGLRSNGLSLVRRVLADHYGQEWHAANFGTTTLGRAVLEPSQIYTPLIVSLTGGFCNAPLARVSAAVHITGGGIPGKLARSLQPSGCGAVLTDLFPPCPIMLHCQELGGIGDSEAYRAWNMGCGLMIITPDPQQVIAQALQQGYEAKIAGETSKEPAIRLRNIGGKAHLQEWLTFPV